MLGRSAAVSGDTVILGADLDADLGEKSGSTYFYDEIVVDPQVVILALLLLLVWRIDRLPADERWAAGGTYGTAFLVALLSYGIWQNQWEATLFAAALVVILSRGSDAGTAPAAPRQPAQSPRLEVE